jgi:hypothetical protein
MMMMMMMLSCVCLLRNGFFLNLTLCLLCLKIVKESYSLCVILL